MAEHPDVSRLEEMVGDSLSSLQERSPADVADKVRFLYSEIQARLDVRARAVGSLLEEECQVGTRLREVVRAYGWFNEVGEKERVQLYQVLRDLEKERRRLYDESFNDLNKLKTDFVDALIEYRGLRRRDRALFDASGDMETHTDTELSTIAFRRVPEPARNMPDYTNPPEYRVP